MICNISSTTFNDYVKHILFFYIVWRIWNKSSSFNHFIKFCFINLHWFYLTNNSYFDFEEVEKELDWIPKQNISYPEKCFVVVHFASNFLFCLKSAFLLFCLFFMSKTTKSWQPYNFLGQVVLGFLVCRRCHVGWYFISPSFFCMLVELKMQKIGCK